MQPSSSSSRGGSRAGSVMYAHSPYVYRTTVEEAPVSPMSDPGHGDPSAVPSYHSPGSLSHSLGNVDNSSLGGLNRSNGNSAAPQAETHSQPIQVGSAPNVLPRYRRGVQSPMTRAGNESGSRGGFPSSPSGSLPPRSPFMAHDDGSSAFAGGESAPVRGPNNPYRMPSGTGLSAPQYSMPLSGSYRSGSTTNGGGGGSGTQSPAPHHARQPSNNGAPISSPFGAPPNATTTAAPAYGCSSSAANNNSSLAATSNGYTPTGFSMPPVMLAAGNGSYHGSLTGRAGSLSGSYANHRSSHPSSPLVGSSGRPTMGNAGHSRGEPISPTHPFSSGSYGGKVNADGAAYSPNNNSRDSSSAPPPAFATAVQQSQQQQQGGGFAVGSFPGRRAAPPSHPSSPFSNHTNFSSSGAGAEPLLMSGSYGTNAKTVSTMADDTISSSSKSGSSASSIRDDLPLCPNDDACTAINDRKHQKKYAHTCRLFPCYHGHVTRHAKLFRHAPGQISLPEGLSAGAKVSTHALASVNFNTISPEAPNAYRIYVSHGDKSYEIFGDWASVKVHTFKRYLHQVYHIPPGSQILSVIKTGKVMDDDINTVKCYGIEEDSVIMLRSDIEDAPAPGKLRIPLDDL
ncbi:hypothetical protein ABB37_08013 [Leptomonas pyrrhocoris]|uniref:Ubiquitin-like domain-containing protein n=1 Tax=Leptomonas pyrrhocoris TaxID=157538 RepID=A0A0N0VDX7_LEPPY|nr:hypothetical protein ABB37_08013 [Leptomonas pyrrhocoris]XP_015654721.1 hypothetical protein ABB37_08013 [Leptomonas pyrrhocoris]KPA76281.1 hypothetical protein ABB37_08013 [Leptomonas pyrrhocoris]KPA76282.1 hypothetical protein ABB37_08013 [Leptomonas pyrrhocoris]|eukprot:XP_015654720.1 hypothetical protein ABB37_08013 [Leptomonas pyrrhocoris]